MMSWFSSSKQTMQKLMVFKKEVQKRLPLVLHTLVRLSHRLLHAVSGAWEKLWISTGTFQSQEILTLEGSWLDWIRMELWVTPPHWKVDNPMGNAKI
jgi:hypothetical protein